MRSALLLLAGCNSFYGLDTTQGRDASAKQFFDARPDAPYACPGPGVAPRFKRTFGQVPVNGAIHYTPSHDWMNALAYSHLGFLVGPIDGPMTTAIPNPSPLHEPRLFPEGDRMIVKDGAMNRIDIYARTDTTWSYATTFRQGAVGNIVVSTPSRGPDRRVVVIDDLQGTGYMLTEHVEQADLTWQAKPAYPIKLPSGSYPSLSADGLRLVFGSTGALGVLYASRATRDAPFESLISLTTVPNQAYYVFLDDNCARLYFSALDTVLYVDQE
ncbi:MAG: hypothetical protein M4D80_15230 [Myxococcota bacterium]|nr:hypothetical protein [Deltaproteobacteria bacterium]MDQ3336518.1 hypothetical protein [Myxococcota bacterium]